MYLRNTWLDPLKEEFVCVWIALVRHYGLTTTSALEGLHKDIKSWLFTSFNDIDLLV